MITLRTGLVLAPVGIINETHEPRPSNGVDRPGFDHEGFPPPGARSASAGGQIPGGSVWRIGCTVVNGLRAGGFSALEGSARTGGGPPASFANPSFRPARVGTPGVKIGGSFWYGGTADTNASRRDRSFGAGGAVLGGRALRSGPFALRGVVANISVTTLRRSCRVRAVRRQPHRRGMSRGPTICCDARPASPRANAFLRHERYDTQRASPPA